MIGLLLADIALTFFGNSKPASVGLAGQLSTVNSIGEAAVALAMGFLVVRFRHKLLYLSGVFLVIASAVGSFLAPTLQWMQVFYFLEGIGSMMTAVIASTLVGNLLADKDKGRVISYVVAAVFLESFVGAPIVNFIAGAEGWRYNFLLFVFPAAVVGLLIALYGIPFKNQKVSEKSESHTISSFRQVFVNRSALFCLLCQFFFIGTSVSLFTLPFFRSQFSLPRTATVYILMAASATYLISSLVTGRLVNKLRAKNLVVVGTLLDGVFIVGLFLAPTLVLSLALNFTHVWFAGMAFASFSCLILDQVPGARGTMISLNSVFGKAGNALTPIIGGLVLGVLSSYSSLGLTLGVMSITGAALVFLFVKNPVNL